MPEKFVVSGATVGFKTGLQANVDTMLAAGANAGAQHGCFYLTKDSHRLYVGNEDTSLSPVNEGIQTLTWAELQAEATRLNTAGAEARKAATGRFYYASDRNILCVYNGQSFVQLNENTNTYVEDFTADTDVTSNVATITHTIKNNQGPDLPADFTVSGSNGIIITEVGTDAETGKGTGIQIAGDTYTLSSEAASTLGAGATIKLDSTNTTNDSEVELVAGSFIEITGGGSNPITIASQDTINESLTITAFDTDDDPETPNVGFGIAVTDDDGHTVEDTIDPTVSWYTSGDPTATTTNSAHFAGGNVVIDTYSRAAIDSKLQAVNAMTYRGTVGNNGTGAASISKTNGVASVVNASDQPIPVSIGDTFLTLSAGNYGGKAYQAGSLLIARSTDGSEVDGVIPANKLDFDVVAEQWNTDTHYVLTPITKGVQLVGSINGDENGAFVVDSGDNWITATEATTGTAPDQTKTVTFTHSNVTRTDTTANTQQSQTAVGSLTIPVITSVTSDAKGHLTGITTTNYVVTDTNGSITDMDATTSVSSNVGTVTISTTFENAKGESPDTAPSASFTISSSSLEITNNDAANNGPEGIAVNMVWGSF